jgi:hypothetical protein
MDKSKAEVGRVREEKRKEDQRRERVRGKKMLVRRSMFFLWLQRVEK